MSPDLQELKRLAESARSAHEYGILLEGDHSETVMPNYYNAASPATILALIEVAEAAKGILAHAGIADADPSDVDEEDRALERRLRAALKEATDV